MIELNSGNVLLKPSHRRHLTTLLKRCVKLGERLGDFVLKISMRRSGRIYEMRASVHDRAGNFSCRSRQHDWRNALRALVDDLTHQLHAQWLRRVAA